LEVEKFKLLFKDELLLLNEELFKFNPSNKLVTPKQEDIHLSNATPVELSLQTPLIQVYFLPIVVGVG
jgi:hypothetical protein